MTKEAQRIAIAEACGNRWIAPTTNVNAVAARICWEYALPNYPEDLNAMHEAEKTLPHHVFNRYVEYLDETTNAMSRTYVIIHATASQRAEAFLRTIGKWAD